MLGKNIAVGVMTNSGIANPVNQLVASYAYARLRNMPDAERVHAEDTGHARRRPRR